MLTHPCLLIDLSRAQRRDLLVEAARQRQAAQIPLRILAVRAFTLGHVRRHLRRVGRSFAAERPQFVTAIAAKAPEKTPLMQAKPPVWAALLLS